jgi:DNA-binding protein HU-beta
MAERAGIGKGDAEKALNAFVEVVGGEMGKGGKVQLIGFGTFEVGERAARTGKNPQTGEPVLIAARKVPKFKPGKALKDEVNR